MSFQAMTWAVEQDLPVKEKMVLMMLANRTNHDTGRCDPSHKRLARDCGMSESSVKRSIVVLEQVGLLTIEARKIGDVNLPNQYVLRFGTVGSDGPGVGSAGPGVGSARPQGVGSHRPTKQESNKQELKQEDKQPPTGEPSAPVLPAWVPADDWADFLAMRKSLGAKGKLTDKAVTLLVNELAKLAKQGHKPAAVLQQSTMNNWKGLFAVKNATGRQAFQAAANFDSVDYKGTADDDFADFLQ